MRIPHPSTIVTQSAIQTLPTERVMPGLQIFLFGAPQILLDNEPIVLRISRRAQALLYFLALEKKTHSRSHIASLFWPDLSDQHARKNLRNIVPELRALLGDYFIIESDSISLKVDGSYWLDVDEVRQIFEPPLNLLELQNVPFAAKTISTEKVLRGATLYTGEFLLGFFIPDAPFYEEWVTTHREYHHHLVVSKLSAFAMQAFEQDERKLAANITRHLIRIDPLNEAGHRLQMRLLALDGQRSYALAYYERIKQQLFKELEVEPDIETQTLAQEIRDGTLPSQPEANERPASAPLTQSAAASTVNGKSENATAANTIPNTFAARLPSLPASFVGREEEIEQLQAMLQHEGRLLTLTGPPGVGKSRLAIATAQRMLDQFVDGALFVPLATVDDPTLVPMAVASVLGVYARSTGATASKTELLEDILHFLQNKRILLVLDNFEHVIDQSPLVGQWLAAAPGVKVITTSRQPLQLYGEQIFQVTPLAFPRLPFLLSKKLHNPHEAQATFADAANFPAVQLFVQRARSLLTTFSLTAANLADIVRICLLCDGLPLAIEMAAGQIRRMTTAQILSHYQQQPLQLGLQLRNIEKRQQTLLKTIEHSYQLLSSAEQQLFCQLSVFVDFVDEATIADVVTVDASAPPLAELLWQLYEKNMILRVDGEVTPQFGMLFVIRQYAALRLLAMESKEFIWRRFVDHYSELVAQVDHGLRSDRQAWWQSKLEQEINNVRHVVQWCADSDFVQALRICTDLAYYWKYAGHWAEAYRWAERLLASSEKQENPPALVLAWAIVKGADFLPWLTDEILHNQLARFERAGDRMGVAFTYGVLAEIVSRRDNALSVAYCESAIAIFETLDDKWHLAYCLNQLALFYSSLGNFSKGEALLNQAMTIASPLGDRILWSQLLNQKSHLCFLQRDYSQAVASSEEALLLQRQLKSDALIVHTLLRLTNALTQLDEFARAEQLLDEFEQLAIAQHDSRHIGLALGCRCRLLTRQRRFAELAECSLQAIQAPFIRDHFPFKLSISLSAVAVALYYGYVAGGVRVGIAIPNCLDRLHSPLSGPEIQSLPS